MIDNVLLIMEELEQGNLSKLNFSIPLNLTRTVRSSKDTPDRKPAQTTLQTLRNNQQLSRLHSAEQGWSPPRIDRQLKSMKQLEVQKQNLMHCLQVLKTSAVCAIEEKQEQITRLHATNRNDQYQQIQFYENQLERSKMIRWQLEEEREELHRQMCLERQHYAFQLEQKELLIDELATQLQRIEQQLYEMEQLNDIKEKKISLLQQKVIELAQQLQTTDFSHTAETQKSNMDLDQTVKINLAASIISTTPNNSYLFNTLHYEDTEKQKNQTIQELLRKHKTQIRDLILFYDRKIQTLYEIIEQDLHPTPTKQEDNGEYRTLNRNSSVRNLIKDLDVSCFNNSALDNKANLDQGQERYEFGLETSRSKAVKHILKNQISTFNFSDYTIAEHRLTTYEDLEEQAHSQAKDQNYCLNKDQSYDTFVMGEYELLTEPKDNPPQLKQDYKQPNPWQKSCIFAAGLFSGVTLTSLLKFVLKQS